MGKSGRSKKDGAGNKNSEPPDRLLQSRFWEDDSHQLDDLDDEDNSSVSHLDPKSTELGVKTRGAKNKKKGKMKLPTNDPAKYLLVQGNKENIPISPQCPGKAKSTVVITEISPDIQIENDLYPSSPQPLSSPVCIVNKDPKEYSNSFYSRNCQSSNGIEHGDETMVDLETVDEATSPPGKDTPPAGIIETANEQVACPKLQNLEGGAMIFKFECTDLFEAITAARNRVEVCDIGWAIRPNTPHKFNYPKQAMGPNDYSDAVQHLYKSVLQEDTMYTTKCFVPTAETLLMALKNHSKKWKQNPSYEWPAMFVDKPAYRAAKRKVALDSQAMNQSQSPTNSGHPSKTGTGQVRVKRYKLGSKASRAHIDNKKVGIVTLNAKDQQGQHRTVLRILNSKNSNSRKLPTKFHSTNPPPPPKLSDQIMFDTKYSHGAADPQIDRKTPAKNKSFKVRAKELQILQSKNSSNKWIIPHPLFTQQNAGLSMGLCTQSNFTFGEHGLNSEQNDERGADKTETGGQNDQTGEADETAPTFSFAEMVNGKLKQVFQGKLKYIPPARLANGQAVVLVDPKTISKASDNYKNVLYGYFVGNDPTLGFARYNLIRMWREYGLTDVTLNGPGIFLFKFDNMQGMQDVLNLGPWMVGTRHLCVQKWEVGLSLKKQPPRTISIWVKFKDLPLELWDIDGDGISRTASILGNPLIADKITQSKCANLEDAGGFARVLIEINSSCTYPPTIKTLYPSTGIVPGKMVEIEVEYQMKPPCCTHCNAFGHSTLMCTVRPRTPEEEAKEIAEKERNDREQSDKRVRV